MLQRKKKPTEPPRSKEYLSVFEDDDDWELLNATPPVTPSTTGVPQFQGGNFDELQTPVDIGNCVDLRGSFEQLERGNTQGSELTEMMASPAERTSKKIDDLELEMDKLRKQNEELKKQADMTEILTKENSVLRKRQSDLQGELGRVEAEKKNALDSLYKEMQEKESWKIEAERLRGILRSHGISIGNNERLQTSSVKFGEKIMNKSVRSNT